MSMTQLVIGTALGFMVGQGVLFGIKHLVGWLRRGELRVRIRALTPGPAIISGFIKYAAPVGVSAAVVTLGAWAVGDYFAAKSARGAATAGLSDPSTSSPASDRDGSPDQVARLAAAPKGEPAAAIPLDSVDPYADSNFKVHRRSRRAGSSANLKETLILRSEAKARADLLRETRQHLQRSQYDCEAADRADRYLKASLDVWGFAAWQVKYFPMDSYKGTTLPQCQDIKNVVAPPVDLQSTVARQNHS